MSVLLEHLTLPEQGPVRLSLDRSFDINITAEEARRKVNSWLLNEVSCNIGAEEPDLAISNQWAVWRVPAVLTAPHLGHVGKAGTVDVDVQTGELKDVTECKEAILRGASDLVTKMPQYIPRRTMPEQYIARGLQPTQTHPQGNPLEIIASEEEEHPSSTPK